MICIVSYVYTGSIVCVKMKMMTPVVKVINTNQLNRSDVLIAIVTFH